MAADGTTCDPDDEAAGGSRWTAQDMLRITVTWPQHDIAVLSLHGDVDASTTPEFRECLGEHLRPGTRIVLDTQHCTFFGSSGLAVLVEARSIAHETGAELRLVVAGQDRVLHRVLAIAGLSGILPVDATVTDATNLRPGRDPQIRDRRRSAR